MGRLFFKCYTSKFCRSLTLSPDTSEMIAHHDVISPGCRDFLVHNALLVATLLWQHTWRHTFIKRDRHAEAATQQITKDESKESQQGNPSVRPRQDVLNNADAYLATEVADSLDVPCRFAGSATTVPRTSRRKSRKSSVRDPNNPYRNSVPMF